MSTTALAQPMGTDAHAGLADALAAAHERVREADAPRVTFEGQLLRPLLAHVGARGAPDERLWAAALAIQLAHEASLVHDDIVDRSPTRRGRASVVGGSGVARALLDGDHLLTSAYRAAAATESMAFVHHFARAVERTVAAERLQGSLLGRVVDDATYRSIATGKAGELIACALASAALLDDAPCAGEHLRVGAEIGCAYQMVDDLLDYCTAVDHGKPTLGDYEQGRWTWPLAMVPDAQLGLARTAVLARLHAPRAAWGGASAFDHCCERLDAHLRDLARHAADLFPGDTIIASLLDGWRERVVIAHDTEYEERRRLARASITQRVAACAADGNDVLRYLGTRSRSFRFASRLLPADDASRIARVYAFCRVTDDLVDDPGRDDDAGATEVLDEWLRLARDAYEGATTGLPLIDEPMREMAVADVPFEYVTALVDGMRSDVSDTRYATLADLRQYTYRVAGVVGLWLARLAGVRDPRALAHAERLGHAMQMSNIVRDVGEDWRRGRVYIPADVLARHGVTDDALRIILDGGPLSDAYRAAIEEMMSIAEADYQAAFAWLPALPARMQPCMAVAAYIYRGLHEAVRRNHHDDIRRRARVSAARKIALAARALADLHRARLAGLPRAHDACPAPLAFPDTVARRG